MAGKVKQPVFSLTFGRLASDATGSYGRRFRMHIACRPAESAVTTATVSGLTMEGVKAFARVLHAWPRLPFVSSWDVTGDGPFDEVLSIREDLSAADLLAEWGRIPYWTEYGFDAMVESGEISVAASTDRTPSVEDAAVFVFHAAPADDPIAGDTFSNVASYYDMITTAVNDPVAVPGPEGQNAVPFYRVDEFDMDFLTVSEAEAFVRKVKFDVACLAEEYRSLHRVREDETVEL